MTKLASICISAFLLFPALVTAQELKKTRERINLLYGEIGGLAGHYSFGYQHNFFARHKLNLAVGAFVCPSLLPIEHHNDGFSPRIGIQAQAVYNFNRHNAVGVGAAATAYTYEHVFEDISVATFLQAGYSYTFSNGLYLGAYFTPLITDGRDLEFEPELWGAIRIGFHL